MTDTFRSVLKRCSPAVLAFTLAFAPTAARPDSSSLDLRAGSGAPPRSLIGSPSLGPAIGGIDYSLLIALDVPPSGYSVGPRITAEAMYGMMDLAPQLRLDLGGRVAFAYHSLDFGPFSNASGSAWILDFVPDAKLRYGINDMVGVYGDFGLGLALMHFSEDVGFGLSGSDTSLALAVQFGAGVTYAITPSMNLLGEVRFDVYTKSGSGLFIAVPTVGLEFH